MQKMLHRSFKAAKCKTALKLAIPRIKLMKNKREAQVKQIKRELAQLLESDQDQTARIRVEHVVREEKTVEAYNLLEIYCELIVARMPMIESQKNCPIDLKEAISSVVFASARCEEIPELKDATKHFTAKYGKEFTSAALELRPNCGVARMLAEKLSANAPDGPTKLNILTAIAKEHNINWDPASFGAKESKIYDDKLNGPNTFTEAAKVSAYSPNIQVPPSHNEQRPPSVQVPNYDKGPPGVQDTKYMEKNDVPTSFSEYGSRSSPNPKNFGYSMSSGTGNQGFMHSYSGNESAYSSPRQHWNMEFKDATTAAQAAAESAELASMAARAAAELSSRGNFSPRYSMSPSHRMRDEEPWKYTGSASQHEHVGRDPVNVSLHGRNSRHYERVDSNEQYARAGNGNKSTNSSFKSTASSYNEETSPKNQTADAYSRRDSFEGRQMDHFADTKRNSGENGDPHNVRVREQSRFSSSRSQSNSFTDDHDVVSDSNWLKSENYKRNSGANRMPFVNELHDTKNSGFADYQEVRIRKQSSHSSSSTFSDDNDVGQNLNSHDDSFIRHDKGSLQRSTKKTTDSYDNVSAVFDNYGSDNNEDHFNLEEEHEVHEFVSPVQRSPTRPLRTKTVPESHIFSEQRATPIFFERSMSPSVPSYEDHLPATFDDNGPSSESDKEKDRSKVVRSTNPSIGSNDSSLEESTGLNFGKLTGGLRNKGYKRPPFPLGSAISSVEAADDASTRINQSSPRAAVEASEPYGKKGSDEVNRKLSTTASGTHDDSSDNDNEEERPKQSFSSTRGQYNKRSSLRVSVQYFGSRNSDSDEDLPKTSLKAHSNTGFSRRTKTSPSNSQLSSNLQSIVSSEPKVVSDYSRSSNANESLPMTQPQKTNSGHSGSFQNPELASQATSRPVSETKRSSSDITLKSSASVPKIISSASAKSLKSQTSIGEGQSKQNASHVHPKLPDIDILTAHFNSLRQNRQ
ncbi:IST1-like protein [Gossypium australe]|uniref:IST1-like protein n=1 Tax=Gossypium australe TaxID=47621 RepID=A0A5B6UM14_9ROSI|nr:IST1-like protein [Gossypium australe]